MAVNPHRGSISISLYETTPRPSPEEVRQQQEEAYRQKLKDMDKVPGAMRMFRTWMLNEQDELRAMVASYVWKRGENQSSLMDGSKGKHTGFFGFADLHQLQKQERNWWELSQSGKRQEHTEAASLYSLSSWSHRTPGRWFVSGTFLGYGHMVVAEHGGRTHYAVPEYIIEPEGADPDFGMRIVMVAEKYGMEIVSVKEARALKTGLVPYWKGRPIK